MAISFIPSFSKKENSYPFLHLQNAQESSIPVGHEMVAGFVPGGGLHRRFTSTMVLISGVEINNHADRT